MEIEKQFNLIAEEYDRNRRKFIPCFDDFYKSTTEFIVSNIDKPERVLDLGAGTGLLAYFWYQQCPDAEYMLVDIADKMLDIARKRFYGIENVSCYVGDYSCKLPDMVFDTVISALSVHHLEDGDKLELFSEIYQILPKGGVFANYDQFCAGQPQMNHWFDSYWLSYLMHGGLSNQEIDQWKERRKLDRECSVEQETGMLKNCGFQTVKCVYSYQKFSVLVAIKQ